MRERKKTNETENRLMDLKALCSYLSMGEIRAAEFAISIGAKRKFGKMARYDKRVIDEALNKLQREELA